MKKPPLIVDRRELAKILGIATRTLAELEGAGVIIPLRRGRGGRASTYAIEAVVPAYLAHVTQAPGTGAEREARRRRDQAQAQFTELKIAKERGELVDIEEVVAAGQAIVKSWTAKIRALPRGLVQTGVIQPDRESRVADQLRALLSEISSWRPVAEKKKRAS